MTLQKWTAGELGEAIIGIDGDSAFGLIDVFRDYAREWGLREDWPQIALERLANIINSDSEE